MAKVASGLRALVWNRAKEHCEYCQMSQRDEPAPFHIDHIKPSKHEGPTTADNLALSCARCSSFKGSNAAGFDPDTGALTPLFNLRTQMWSEHFRWEGVTLIGISAVGRTTIQVLKINVMARVARRIALIAAERFPPVTPDV